MSKNSLKAAPRNLANLGPRNSAKSEPGSPKTAAISLSKTKTGPRHLANLGPRNSAKSEPGSSKTAAISLSKTTTGSSSRNFAKSAQRNSAKSEPGSSKTAAISLSEAMTEKNDFRGARKWAALTRKLIIGPNRFTSVAKEAVQERHKKSTWGASRWGNLLLDDIKESEVKDGVSAETKRKPSKSASHPISMGNMLDALTGADLPGRPRQTTAVFGMSREMQALIGNKSVVAAISKTSTASDKWRGMTKTNVINPNRIANMMKHTEVEETVAEVPKAKKTSTAVKPYAQLAKELAAKRAQNKRKISHTQYTQRNIANA